MANKWFVCHLFFVPWKMICIRFQSFMPLHVLGALSTNRVMCWGHPYETAKSKARGSERERERLNMMCLRDCFSLKTKLLEPLAASKLTARNDFFGFNLCNLAISQQNANVQTMPMYSSSDFKLKSCWLYPWLSLHFGLHDSLIGHGWSTFAVVCCCPTDWTPWRFVRMVDSASRAALAEAPLRRLNLQLSKHARAAEWLEAIRLFSRWRWHAGGCKAPYCKAPYRL